MAFPRSLLEEILRKVDVVEVVQKYVHLKQRGGRYWGLSPFKHEKTPSFSVDREKGLYYCFSTHQGGSLFQFLIKMEGYTFPQAVQHLADLAGLDLSQYTYHTQSNYHNELEILQRISSSFHYLLYRQQGAQEAENYLKKRKVSTSLAKKFLIGYAPRDPHWVFNFLRKHQYSEKAIRNTGLLTSRGLNAFFKHRIMFPITNTYGKVVGFGARALRENDIKYLNSRETPFFRKKELLFGFLQAKETIRKNRLVYVVEGYFDVLALHAIQIDNVVAPLGTALGEEQILFLKNRVDHVVILFDGDEAGQNAAFRVGKLAERMNISIESVFLPAGKDPSDFLQEGREGELKDLLKNSQSFFSQFINLYKDKGYMHKPEAVRYFSRKVFEYLKEVPSKIRRDQYLQLFADAFLLDKTAVELDFYRGIIPEKQLLTKGVYEDSYVVNADISLLALAMRDMTYFARVRDEIGVEDIWDMRAREMYYRMEQVYRELFAQTDALKMQFSQIVISRVSDEKIQNLFLREMNQSTDQDASLLDRAIRVVKERSLRQQQRDMERKIMSMRKESFEKETYKSLLAQKKEIEDKIDLLQRIR